MALLQDCMYYNKSMIVILFLDSKIYHRIPTENDDNKIGGVCVLVLLDDVCCHIIIVLIFIIRLLKEKQEARTKHSEE